MAKICSSCGAEVRDGAQFCPECGKKIQGENKVSPKVQIPVVNTKNTAKKSSPIDNVLIAALSVVMIAELVIIAYVKPGILRTDHESTGTVAVEQVNNAIEEGSTDLTEEQIEAMLSQIDYSEDFPEPLSSTGELAFRYTREQIENAPVQKAKVTRDDPTADFGSVKVDLMSWNLENEEDELILRTLPEIYSEEDDLTFQCWDFSLASGQDEFITSVGITFERNSGAAMDGLSFNDETGLWEDEYCELSEDGSQRTMYVTHFCVKGFYFDKDELELKKGNLDVNLDHGIYCETLAKDSQKKGMMGYVNRMTLPVKVDEDRMWQMYKKKNLDDVGKLPELIKAVSTDADKAAEARRVYDKSDCINTFFGYVGFGSNIVSLFSVAPEAMMLIGAVCLMSDILLTPLKVIEEANSGNRGFANAIWDATMNHKLDLTGTAVGISAPAAAVFSTTAGLWFGVAAIALFSFTVVYNQSMEIEDLIASVKMKDPKTLYKGYYSFALLRADFGSKMTKDVGKEEYAYAIMKKPSSMDQKKYDALAAAVAKKGLREKDMSGWAQAFVEIIKAYPGEASYLQTVLDELYYSYANLFWELPPEKVEAFKKEYGATADISSLTQEQKHKISQDYAFEVKIRTRSVLQEAAKTVQREQYKEYITSMKEKMVPLLNTQLIFHLKDESLGEGQTLKDSVYYYDWRTSKENRKVRANKGNYGNYTVSMKFEGADKPLFYPVDYTGEEGDPKQYYPYGATGCFLPVMPGKGDVIFSCTLYHYMMMGCPERMIFTDPKNPDAEPENVLIDISAVDGIKKKVDIYLKVGGSKEDEQYKLRISDDRFDAGTNVTVSLGDPQPPEISTLTIHPNGSFDLEVASMGELEWMIDEQRQISVSRQGFSCKGLLIYTREKNRRGLLTSMDEVSSESVCTDFSLKKRHPESAETYYKTSFSDAAVMPKDEKSNNWEALSESYSYIDITLDEKTGKPKKIQLGLRGGYKYSVTTQKETREHEDKKTYITFEVIE